jgi:membrane-associated protease RseP (regulator of RpoE activity)
MTEAYEAAGWSDAFPAPRVRPRVWLHWLLLALTVGTTTLAGSGFLDGLFGTLSFSFAWQHAVWLDGIAYSATILAILGSHEMGHYVACRYYGIDVSLPFFLPIPIPLTGTAGAFIRIRQPIRLKREIFDIGIAGPLAGFVVLLPALFLGVYLSHVIQTPTRGGGLELGEPLLFRLASWLIWGDVADGHTLVAHPIAFGAWFGMLATAMNLFPIGQLDGGHIAYAVFGRRSTYITYAGVATAVALTTVSATWYVWTALLLLMLFVFGPRHPSVLDEETPLGRGRLVLAVLALAVLALCFTPVPLDLVSFGPEAGPAH